MTAFECTRCELVGASRPSLLESRRRGRATSCVDELAVRRYAAGGDRVSHGELERAKAGPGTS